MKVSCLQPKKRATTTLANASKTPRTRKATSRDASGSVAVGLLSVSEIVVVWIPVSEVSFIETCGVASCAFEWTVKFLNWKFELPVIELDESASAVLVVDGSRSLLTSGTTLAAHRLAPTAAATSNGQIWTWIPIFIVSLPLCGDMLSGAFKVVLCLLVDRCRSIVWKSCKKKSEGDTLI
jgi:hypothetical protein